MSSKIVYSSGIYHGLPTFPEHTNKQYTTIVTGANGITGHHMVRVLSAAPVRWKTIYALSRRPPTRRPPTHPESRLGEALVKHIAVDFLTQTPEEIAAILKENGVTADYVFFASYVQVPPKDGGALWSDEKEMTHVNMTLLVSFLASLPLANIHPTRILLQTGAKHYGLHLGPTPTPMEESDPRPTTAPNFYFPQEDALAAHIAKYGGSYTITRPGFILGAVRGAAMNVVYALAVYAAVQKELGAGLEWPGDVWAWDAEKHLSSAWLIGRHAEWAVLTEGAGGEALNISDGGAFAWGKFWGVLGGWYGIPVGRPEEDEGKFVEVTMPFDVPPRGFGGPGKIKIVWTFAAWAEKPEVREAWGRLAKKHGIAQDPFQDSQSTLGLLDAELLGAWGRSISMNKSRKLGWHGFVDTADAIKDVINELAELKMVPPLEKFGNGK